MFDIRLHEKYKGMLLLDKNPKDDDEDLPEEEWEYRVISGLGWMKKRGLGC